MRGQPPVTPRYRNRRAEDRRRWAEDRKRRARADGGRDPGDEQGERGRRGYRAAAGAGGYRAAGEGPPTAEGGRAPGGYGPSGEGRYGRGGYREAGPEQSGHETGAARASAGRQRGTARAGAPRGMETARYPEQFVDHLTPEMRMLLDDSIEASQVAAWCADRCIDHGPEAGDCVRLCNEVAQIADLNANFISKDAFNVLAVTEAFVVVAEQAIAELEEIPQLHSEETRAVLERAIDSANNVL